VLKSDGQHNDKPAGQQAGELMPLLAVGHITVEFHRQDRARGEALPRRIV